MNIYRRVKQMSKHLAKPEKTKKNPVIDFSAKEIHIPEKKQKKKTKSHVSKAEDTFQTAMLNKTLDRKFSLSELALAITALVLLVVVNFLPTSGIVRLLSFLVPFLLAGYSYLFEAFQEAFMGIVLGRELIVTVASLMAFCAGSYNGGAAVMIFLKLSDMALAYAEMMQAEKVNALYSLRPEKANLVNENTVSVVKAETLKKDQVIELYVGDIVPTDGVVIDGTSVLDASTLVGGSLSFPVAAGSTAISGCVNVTARTCSDRAERRDVQRCAACGRELLDAQVFPGALDPESRLLFDPGACHRGVPSCDRSVDLHGRLAHLGCPRGGYSHCFPALLGRTEREACV